MSYILDALKKSEKERSLGNVPTLVAADQNQGRAVPLHWFMLTVACFVVLLVAVAGWILWPSQGAQGPATGSATAGGSPATALSAGESETKEAAVRAPAAASSIPVPISEVGESVRAHIPEFKINVLSYSENSSKRFVMIGQDIYKEGEEITAGLVVAEIRNSDVVFSFDGVLFTMQP